MMHPISELAPWTPEERERLLAVLDERDRQIIMGARPRTASFEIRERLRAAQQKRREKERLCRDS